MLGLLPTLRPMSRNCWAMVSLILLPGRGVEAGGGESESSLLCFCVFLGCVWGVSSSGGQVFLAKQWSGVWRGLFCSCFHNS